ncbi:MAG: hypothetical protein M0Q90_07450 [Bacteroidales bacterium]|nr:hypothetical protein [Bacteroidales bacterium]
MKNIKKRFYNFLSVLGRYGYAHMAIFVFAVVIITTIFNNNRWKTDRGLVIHDVTSYYSYLPAVIIHGDLKFRFLDDDPDFFKVRIANSKTPEGGHYQKMTMGLAFLYLPFFLLGHLYAWISGVEMNGYSLPYMFFLQFAALFYVLAALFVLRKILLKLVSDKLAALVILVIGLGTNLFFYTTLEAAMSHAFNFSLFIFFITLTIRWHEKPKLKNSILIGLAIGLITLIRPTNALLVLFFLLYDYQNFKHQISKLFGQWKLLLIITLFGFLVVVPQLLFWKINTGHWIFYSYGKEGFFFDKPQIWCGLFSYRKGWLIYTPVMVFALAGIFMLRKQFKAFWLPILVFVVVNLYVIFSWWDWSYGGSFSARPMIDSYGLMAIPLAAFLFFTQQRSRLAFGVLGFVLFVLCSFNLFQTAKYKYGSIHYAAMSKAAYWHTLFRIKNDTKFHELLEPMNYDSLVEGKYVIIPPIYQKVYQEAFTSFENISPYSQDFLSPDKHYAFINAELQVDYESRSGEHSVMLSGENRFAANIEFWVKEHEIYELSVWKKPVDSRGALVFAAPDPEVLYEQDEGSAEADSAGWRKIQFQLSIPRAAANQKCRVYLWNKTTDTVFFDDMKIRKLTP